MAITQAHTININTSSYEITLGFLLDQKPKFTLVPLNMFIIVKKEVHTDFLYHICPLDIPLIFIVQQTPSTQ